MEFERALEDGPSTGARVLLRGGEVRVPPQQAAAPVFKPTPAKGVRSGRKDQPPSTPDRGSKGGPLSSR